jgi:hypothetical protein
VNDSSVKELLDKKDGFFPSRESGLFQLTSEIKGVGGAKKGDRLNPNERINLLANLAASDQVIEEEEGV